MAKNNILPIILGLGAFFMIKKANAANTSTPALTEGFWGTVAGQKGLQYKPFFDAAESQYNIPNNILAKMGWRESRWNPDVVSGVQKGPSGELGIMQITPRWHPGVNYTIPKDAILYAGKYLRENYNKFGSWPLATMAYNWGPGNTAKWLEWPERNLNTIPPVTYSYLKEVYGNNVSV